MPEAKTRMPAGAKGAMIKLAVGVFHACMRRNTTLNRLTGKMPKVQDVAAGIRRQTPVTMPIVRCDDLRKHMGDEVTFHFDQPVGAYPIMGSEYAKGRGVGMGLDEDRLRINQARFPLDLGDNMTELRQPYEMRSLGRPKLQRLMDGYIDQSILVHMAGARGFHDNKIEWQVPLASHPRFAQILINRVKAPTRNRHLVAAAGSITEPVNNSGELQIATTDMFSMDIVDSVRSWMDQIPLPPPPVQFEGDVAATDSPIRVMLVSPAQYHQFATDKDFRTYQANAYQRARLAKDHPLFLGEAGLWNGILIVKMPKPIRFYAGDELKICESYTSEEETALKVPDSFGGEFAVDRAILLGGQALAQAFGSSRKSGFPFFWSEEEDDHGDKMEMLIGAILGMSKVRFAVDNGEERHFTDHGVTVLDTAVKIIKPRG